MKRTAQQILEEVRQLPQEQREWLLENLLAGSDEEFAAWQRAAGEPGPGYDAWFRAGVQAALDDDSPDVSHEEVVNEIGQILKAAHAAQELKATA